jgi:hypothetical protein
MELRGVTLADVNTTLDRGWDASDAAPGSSGKVFVFDFNDDWEGRHFEEKEVTVYFRYNGSSLIPLTVKARYGRGFPRKDSDED